MDPTSSHPDIIDFVVNKGHGVKGLADMGINSLPRQYIQPLEERFSADFVAAEETIPVIDMSDLDDKKMGDRICDAAEKWGFFQVINHGVPCHVLEKVKEAAHRFFSLPAEEKNKYSKEHSSTNNVRFGTSFTPQAERALEWKDWLSLFYVSHEEALALWPTSCRDEVIDYMMKSEVVITKLLEVLMKRLNVREIDHENTRSLLMGSKRINLNYYPKCPNPELTIGVGRHSDVSTLTILLQDEIGGLYVRKLDDADFWIQVPPIPDALVINIGDALQILSNGRYRSVEHRVIANGSQNRVSVPIFVNPRPGDVIGPLQEVLDKEGEKPKYKEVLYSDYVKHFFRKAHDGKQTVEFAAIKH